MDSSGPPSNLVPLRGLHPSLHSTLLALPELPLRQFASRVVLGWHLRPVFRHPLRIGTPVLPVYISHCPEGRWGPAHKGIAGNEKADERARIAAEGPDPYGVEWLAYSDRTEERATPLPRSLANLKREIEEKRCVGTLV